MVRIRECGPWVKPGSASQGQDLKDKMKHAPQPRNLIAGVPPRSNADTSTSNDGEILTQTGFLATSRSQANTSEASRPLAREAEEKENKLKHLMDICRVAGQRVIEDLSKEATAKRLSRNQVTADWLLKLVPTSFPSQDSTASVEDTRGRSTASQTQTAPFVSATIQATEPGKEQKSNQSLASPHDSPDPQDDSHKPSRFVGLDDAKSAISNETIRCCSNCSTRNDSRWRLDLRGRFLCNICYIVSLQPRGAASLPSFNTRNDHMDSGRPSVGEGTPRFLKTYGHDARGRHSSPDASPDAGPRLKKSLNIDGSHGSKHSKKQANKEPSKSIWPTPIKPTPGRVVPLEPAVDHDQDPPAIPSISKVNQRFSMDTPRLSKPHSKSEMRKSSDKDILSPSKTTQDIIESLSKVLIESAVKSTNQTEMPYDNHKTRDLQSFMPKERSQDLGPITPKSSTPSKNKKSASAKKRARRMKRERHAATLPDANKRPEDSRLMKSAKQKPMHKSGRKSSGGAALSQSAPNATDAYPTSHEPRLQNIHQLRNHSSNDQPTYKSELKPAGGAALESLVRDAMDAHRASYEPRSQIFDQPKKRSLNDQSTHKSGWKPPGGATLQPIARDTTNAHLTSYEPRSQLVDQLKNGPFTDQPAKKKRKHYKTTASEQDEAVVFSPARPFN